MLLMVPLRGKLAGFVLEEQDTPTGEERAGGRRPRLRRRQASLLESAVLSAPPAVPLFLQQRQVRGSRPSYLGSGSPFPSLPVLLRILSPRVVWGSAVCVLNTRTLALGSGNSDLKACRVPFLNLGSLPSFTHCSRLFSQQV